MIERSMASILMGLIRIENKKQIKLGIYLKKWIDH